MAVDPICKMMVEETTSLRAEQGGDTPQRGHHGRTTDPPVSAKYFCPMCSGVEADKPGDCPKCGMALEQNPASRPAAKTIDTCPMQPNFQQDHSGKCPKWGITLEPRSTTEEENAELAEMARRL